MPVVIGQVVSLTGNNPGGSENQLGAQLAVAELNSQGGLLGGQHVELLLADDRTQPSHAVTAFANLVDHGVCAVVGTSFSNASLAILPEAEAARVPYISTGAADSQVQPVRPYAFMTPPTATAVAEQLLRYFKAQKLTKLAIAYDDNSMFAKTGLEKQTQLAGEHGVEFVHLEKFHVDTTDFEPMLTRIQSSGADAIMAWATGPPAVELVRQRPADLPFVMSHGNSDQRFLDATGATAEGVIAAASLGLVAGELPASDVRDAGVSFTKAFQERHGRSPSSYAIDGYTAVMLIASAISRAGSDEPKKVRDSLEGLETTTPQGRYHYSASDHQGLNADQVAVTTIENGRFVLTEWSRNELAVTMNTHRRLP
ncbi:ABC transporter substrate-binding protein [Sinomonas sp. JGH33]|uniref:ABC transporter substrate-binding protein n=1 Tax=Sinomonas terricola TaxID=3110330 RepID=A0ABU5T9C9_9MICC|nr:ABC transporter substrate-binding protein [Sinomonas sp. JGH33]MEA5456300.1 ABC transporter substrate-binding protein [Sinomonas sp. JGH33]